MSTVNVDQLADAIATELANYSKQVTDGIKDEVQNAADDCVNTLKQTSPKRTGGYAKSWTATKAFENSTDIRVVVHNKKYYRLTHVLEHGHAKVGGGRVEARPHIEAAEKAAAEQLQNKIKVVIKG